MSCEIFAGNVAGSLNFVPNPDALHGYATINGVVDDDSAIASPCDVNAAPVQVPGGKDDGSLNFVPKPELLHG